MNFRIAKTTFQFLAAAVATVLCLDAQPADAAWRRTPADQEGITPFFGGGELAIEDSNSYPKGTTAGVFADVGCDTGGCSLFFRMCEENIGDLITTCDPAVTATKTSAGWVNVDLCTGFGTPPSCSSNAWATHAGAYAWVSFGGSSGSGTFEGIYESW